MCTAHVRFFPSAKKDTGIFMRTCVAASAVSFMCIFVVPEAGLSAGCIHCWVQRAMLRNKIIEGELETLRNDFTGSVRQQDQLRMQMDYKDFEIGRLKAKIASQDKLLQDCDLQMKVVNDTNHAVEVRLVQ